MPKGFTLKDVAKVDLYNRERKSPQCVQHGNRSMGIRPGVQDKTRRRMARFLYPIDKHTLVICLTEDDFVPRRGRLLSKSLLDVGKRTRPINLRLAIANEIQVRAIENIYRLH